MAAKLYCTADMVRALPDDGNRHEVVHGESPVTPSPRPLHQLVLERLHLALGTYLEWERVGQLLGFPADISWGTEILVQPDLFVVELLEARTLDIQCPTIEREQVTWHPAGADRRFSLALSELSRPLCGRGAVQSVRGDS